MFPSPLLLSRQLLQQSKNLVTPTQLCNALAVIDKTSTALVPVKNYKLNIPVCVFPRNIFEQYVKSNRTLGRKDGVFWVTDRSTFDSFGIGLSHLRIERLLGMDPGYYPRDQDLVMVVIDKAEEDDFRLPSGSEGGANDNWREGGYAGWPHAGMSTPERVASSRNSTLAEISSAMMLVQGQENPLDVSCSIDDVFSHFQK